MWADLVYVSDLKIMTNRSVDLLLWMWAEPSSACASKGIVLQPSFLNVFTDGIEYTRTVMYWDIKTCFLKSCALVNFLVSDALCISLWNLLRFKPVWR